jgi:hypothetical protein
VVALLEPPTPPQTASLADEDERALREALKLPRTSSCRTWRCIRDEEEEGSSEGGSMRLVAVGCPACLVSPTHSHGTSKAHSCIMVSGRGGGATLCCYTHGSRRLGGKELATVRRSLRHLLGTSDKQAVEVADSQPKLIDVLRERVLGHAAAHRLRKAGEAIWRPVPGCPCAYVEGETFRDFLNDLLGDDPDYQATRVQDELVKYLRNYNPVECRTIVRDRGLLSFSNGVLLLQDARFVAYPETAAYPDFELEGRIARNHIAAPYTGSTATPLLDRILSAQLSGEVTETLMVLIGRLLFLIGERDSWQVSFLFGGGAPRAHPPSKR